MAQSVWAISQLKFKCVQIADKVLPALALTQYFNQNGAQQKITKVNPSDVGRAVAVRKIPIGQTNAPCASHSKNWLAEKCQSSIFDTSLTGNKSQI